MTRPIFALASLLAIAAPACMTDDAPVTDEVTAPDGAGDDAKADTATELSVRAGDTTLWVQQLVARKGNTFVVHARTSRNLVDDVGTGYVFDDPYGAFAKKSARVFEVSYGVSELGPLEDGVNLFVGFEAVGGHSLTSRMVIRPRLAAAAGSSKLAFTAEVTPIVVDGATVFRVQGRSTVAMTAVASTAGAAALVDPQHFTIDLSRADVAALAGTTTTLAVSATLATGTVTRHANLTFSIKALGLTTGDAYAQWPAPTCTAKLKACLTALPGGAIDLSSCGDANTTLACEGQVGVVVDGPAITQAMATTDARLADPAGFGGDASGLVGADRAASLATALRAKIQDATNALSGRWYLAAATRDARLSTAVDGSFDRAYARPLELIGARAPVPGDADVTRQVAADALLQYLTTQDYVHSEWERSFDQLTIDYRAQHVASLREFREAPDDLFTDPVAYPNQTVYIGQWLGAHTEITIDNATGAAVNVLVELD